MGKAMISRQEPPPTLGRIGTAQNSQNGFIRLKRARATDAKSMLQLLPASSSHRQDLGGYPPSEWYATSITKAASITAIQFQTPP